MRQHVRDLELQPVPDALEIDSDDAVEVVRCRILHRPEASLDAGVIDRHMQPAEALYGPLHCRLHRGHPADIGFEK